MCIKECVFLREHDPIPLLGSEGGWSLYSLVWLLSFVNEAYPNQKREYLVVARLTTLFAVGPHHRA
jgi:hypothetical protein